MSDDGAAAEAGEAGDATAVFQRHRDRLFGIAYRMLGTVGDAEDVLQDAWLRWSRVTDPVDRPGAYLARTVTNLALNRLTSAAAQRERYVGPWLPEPLVAESAPDVAEEVEQAESVSLAMLVVLESLSPAERAVFVLHEVFGYPHAEIAEALGRSEAAVRQLARRARSHVAARRPRFDTSAEQRRRVTEEFLAACLGGDLGRMMELLAPDVVVWSDGGGRARAALRPVHGADRTVRWLRGVMNHVPDLAVFPALVNGRPGVVVTSGGRVDSVASIDLGPDGRIAELRVVRNPEKLRHVPLPQAPSEGEGA
ncbi:RNA polymerase sigma-70 factor [Streptomyces sp. B6B3]|uniref:RNA polymerase sigma-70 factor n=1 Tax=Streptomyces sp. B6B3 TaxID=3153570 RepID=UPI00325E647B